MLRYSKQLHQNSWMHDLCKWI